MSLESPATDADDLDALASDLGDAIAESPVYREFAAAKDAVESDDQLQERIREFERRREEFAVARQAGEASQQEAEQLRRTQQRLHDDPTMSEFLEARERLRDRLEELNRAISEPLSIDFGGEAGGCCHDE